jgi:hypothetical protein
MKMHEESSFLRGIESRLDSLFAEDTEIKTKPVNPPEEKNAVHPSLQEIPLESPVTSAPTLTTDTTPLLSETAIPAPDTIPLADSIPTIAPTAFAATDTIPITGSIPPVDPIPATALTADKVRVQDQQGDKSAFISEIEKRFSAIFGEDTKDTFTAKTEPAIKPASLNEMIALAEKDIEPQPIPVPLLNQSLDEVSSSSILHSPLKNLKSIVLSIEWEISNQVLEQFDGEIAKLNDLYSHNRINLGFLRILRFLGRYIRVKGADSNQESVNLLLSVYDSTESVIVKKDLTETQRNILLLENIKKYRSWVEKTDLEPITGMSKPPEEKPIELKPVFVETIAPVEEKPFELKLVPEQPAPPIELRSEGSGENIIAAPTILSHPTKATEIAIPPGKEFGDTEQATLAIIKDMTPQEAFAYGLEDIKKNFQIELSALKEEIRLLKAACK